MKEENKMATVPMKKLFWKMGLPMIISMVLQALYNVVDSIFVTNMGEDGVVANQGLTLAFPIQILMIAFGVGTGVGLNALLSKSLGEKENEKVNKIAGNGIFLSLCMFFVFFLFGIFAKPLSSLFGLAGGTSLEIIEICTNAIKIASIGYIFMGISVSIQGVLQSLEYAGKPLVISFLRLVVFVFPIAYLFTLSESVTSIVWWTFPIAEVLTSIIAIFILKSSYKKKVSIMPKSTS